MQLLDVYLFIYFIIRAKITFFILFFMSSVSMLEEERMIIIIITFIFIVIIMMTRTHLIRYDPLSADYLRLSD